MNQINEVRTARAWLVAAATVSLATLTACGGGGDATDAEPRSTSAGAGEIVLADAPLTPSSVLDGASEQAMALNVGSSISATHVLGQTETSPLFATQNWTIQCDGYSTKVWNIPESGIHGAALEDGSTLKFGKAVDPLNSASRALVFRANQRNVEAAEAQRCEGTFNETAQRIPEGEVVWQAFRIYLPDWSKTMLGDTQTVMQWYHGNPEVEGGLQPVLAMNITRNALQFNARYSTAEVPTKDNTVSRTIFRMEGGFQQRWLDVVIQGSVSTRSSNNPFVKVWINGAQVASYTGPLGYNLPKRPQVKFGVYKFDSSTWDMSIPTREMYLKEMLLVRDPSRAYSEPMLRAEVQR